MIEVLAELLNPLAVILLLTALIIAARDSVSMIITTYRFQSLLLAAITGLTALFKLHSVGQPLAGWNTILVISVVALPLGLAVFIKPLLARATVQRESQSITTEIRLMLVWCFRPLVAKVVRADLADGSAAAIAATRPGGGGDGERQPSTVALMKMSYGIGMDAERAWLLYKPSTRMEARYLLMFFLLVGSAFLLIFKVTGSGTAAGGEFLQSDQIGLVVSVSLNLIGLYNMSIRQDIISQVVGLLIMDHGLFLALVKLVDMPTPAGFFVISLYLYTLITIFILVVLLPRLRGLTNSLSLSDIRDESELKG